MPITDPPRVWIGPNRNRNKQGKSRPRGKDKRRVPILTRSLRSPASGREELPNLGPHKSNGRYTRIRGTRSRNTLLCKACKGCGECRFKREKCSEEERLVLDRVEKEME